ncbi:MAG TPA: hypothetical protein VFA66_07100 [Gaiellaceae bacterium]|nr:hypothetical protein [Gaiellaceae bacterium]
MAVVLASAAGDPRGEAVERRSFLVLLRQVAELRADLEKVEAELQQVVDELARERFEEYC